MKENMAFDFNAIFREMRRQTEKEKVGIKIDELDI